MGRSFSFSILCYNSFLILPENAILKVDGNLKQWTHDGLVPTLMMFFLVPGIVYGKVAGTIKMIKMLLK